MATQDENQYYANSAADAIYIKREVRACGFYARLDVRDLRRVTYDQAAEGIVTSIVSSLGGA